MRSATGDEVGRATFAGSDGHVSLTITCADSHHRLQFQSPGEQYATAVFAGLVIASIPVFVVFMLGMRQFVSGVVTGALKV